MEKFAPHGKMRAMKPLTYLRLAREQAKLTLEEVSARLSRSGINLSPGQLSRLERGESEVTRQRLQQLGRLYDWTPAELLGGRSTEEEPRPRARMVPLIDSVQAGHWTDVADPYAKGDADTWIPVLRHVGPRAFALTIEGASMEPEFRSGDVIVVDPDVGAQPGRFVVARVDEDNAATFKRYREKGRDGRGRPIVELVPLNPDWPVLSVANSKGGRIVGVAVEHHRALI
jgi:SOS-response transcriptional repressor LexA